MKYAILAARLLIGGLFVYASIYKVLNPADFAVAIRNYLLLPPEWSTIAALALPWIELVAGSFLILGAQVKPSALLTTGMLSVFLVAIVYAYQTGLDIDCGCFGSPESSTGHVGLYHIVRESCLVLVSLAILLFDRGHFSIEGLFGFATAADSGSSS